MIETERGVMYWNMEIDPEEVNRRMERTMRDREEEAFRAFAESQRIFEVEVRGDGIHGGEIFLIAAGRQLGKSRLFDICVDMETQVVEAAIAPPKNQPHYRRIGRGSRY